MSNADLFGCNEPVLGCYCDLRCECTRCRGKVCGCQISGPACDCGAGESYDGCSLDLFPCDECYAKGYTEARR